MFSQPANRQVFRYYHFEFKTNMSVPKSRKTSSRTRKGRSHLALKKTILSKCSKCGSAVRPHYACPSCGTYKTREVIRTQADKKAAQKAKKERKEKEAQKKMANK